MKRHLPWKLSAAGACLLLASATVAAAPAEDWPCVQRKVPELSVAAIWMGPPLDEAAPGWRTDPDISRLVERLAARRTSQVEARQAIAELASSSGAAKGRKLQALIAGLIETVNAERGEVIAGLERFGAAQKKMAAQLREENARLAGLRADAKADPARLNELSEHLVWSLRVFEERQKSLRFVCEVPVLIEQRLFALSRAIQEALAEQ
jgi:hypothetical protein